MSPDEAQKMLADVRRFSDAASVVSGQVEARRREAVLMAVEAGMSQSEIARQLGLTPARVNQIVKDTR